jgi:hypothetical protein
MSEFCVCGRPKVPTPGGLARSPAEAELMQRLRTISETRVDLAARGALTPERATQLAAEERALRRNLSALVHG